MAAEKDQQKDAEVEGLSATTLLPKLIPSGAGREWLERRRATIRPWGSFVDQRRFSRPRNVGELCQRLVRNVEYYQSNYVFVFLGLILYCVATSPMLLVALAVFFGACYILYLRTLQSKFVLMGISCRYPHWTPGGDLTLAYSWAPLSCFLGWKWKNLGTSQRGKLRPVAHVIPDWHQAPLRRKRGLSSQIWEAQGLEGG
ncbi:prenylated Rab acceptor protein 1 isoform X1 [Delphinapterus leucas]|uniref:PRA1 family protein n=1 Tax=Delphinapterus leucas TaxID=9749 RepID=A0A2Y9P540_DELLE|nr:prenylated Rab acceptor protein 1 isoform X1 [Delphinapterus leucas]